MAQKPHEYFRFCPGQILLIKQKQAQRTFLLFMLSEIICRNIIPFIKALILVNLESLQRILALQYNVNCLYIKNINFRSHITPFIIFFNKRGCHLESWRGTWQREEPQRGRNGTSAQKLKE